MTTNMTVQKTGAGTGTGIAALGTGPSVLGQAQTSIPIGGKVRPGIMVLTKAAEQNDAARTLYERLSARRIGYQEINRQIKAECKLQRNPMTPKNVPYFTVRPADFKNPGNAALIFNTYASDKGDGEGRQLYRIPIMFPVDNWQAIMPHQFACYTAGEKKYSSEYLPDGSRMCQMREAVNVNGQGKDTKAHRPAGGRKLVYRPENDGRCDPDNCPEYQARECTLTGSLLFHIPGIPGADAIEMPTRSFYGLTEIRQTLEMVAFMHGKISGTFQGAPMFFLTKKQQRVSRLDPKTGKAQRVNQWIIQLDTEIDITSMHQANEAPAMLAAGSEAAAALTLDDTIDMDIETGEIINRTSAPFVAAGVNENPAHRPELPAETIAQTIAETDPADELTNREADLSLMIDEAASRHELNALAADITDDLPTAVIVRLTDRLKKRHDALPAESGE